MPLLLPKLNIINSEIERSEYLKFLVVLLDENLCWKEHIKYIVLKVKLLKILGCYIRQSPILINIRFGHCIILTYIPILSTETLHGEVQPGQTSKKYTVNRNMLSELYIVKVDCDLLENFLRSVKNLMCIK